MDIYSFPYLIFFRIQIPEDRFHLSDCTNLKVRTGNFINGVDEFDHKWVHN